MFKPASLWYFVMATRDDDYDETLLWRRETVNTELSEIPRKEYRENDGAGDAMSMLTDRDKTRILYKKRELTIKTDERIQGMQRRKRVNFLVKQKCFFYFVFLFFTKNKF